MRPLVAAAIPSPCCRCGAPVALVALPARHASLSSQFAPIFALGLVGEDDVRLDYPSALPGSLAATPHLLAAGFRCGGVVSRLLLHAAADGGCGPSGAADIRRERDAGGAAEIDCTRA